MTTETAHALPEDDQLFLLLRQLDAAPDASQRATAQALGVSLGRLNAQLRAVTAAGDLSAEVEAARTAGRPSVLVGVSRDGRTLFLPLDIGS